MFFAIVESKMETGGHGKVPSKRERTSSSIGSQLGASHWHYKVSSETCDITTLKKQFIVSPAKHMGT